MLKSRKSLIKKFSVEVTESLTFAKSHFIVRHHLTVEEGRMRSLRSRWPAEVSSHYQIAKNFSKKLVDLNNEKFSAPAL